MKFKLLFLIVVAFTLCSCSAFFPDKSASCTIIIQNDTDYGTAIVDDLDTGLEYRTTPLSSTTFTCEWEYGYDEDDARSTSFLYVEGITNSAIEVYDSDWIDLHDGKTYIMHFYEVASYKASPHYTEVEFYEKVQ